MTEYSHWKESVSKSNYHSRLWDRSHWTVASFAAGLHRYEFAEHHQADLQMIVAVMHPVLVIQNNNNGAKYMITISYPLGVNINFPSLWLHRWNSSNNKIANLPTISGVIKICAILIQKNDCDVWLTLI